MSEQSIDKEMTEARDAYHSLSIAQKVEFLNYVKGDLESVYKHLTAALGQPSPAPAAPELPGYMRTPAAKGPGRKGKRGPMSAEARAKIAAAQKARWAKQKKSGK